MQIKSTDAGNENDTLEIGSPITPDCKRKSNYINEDNYVTHVEFVNHQLIASGSCDFPFVCQPKSMKEMLRNINIIYTQIQNKTVGHLKWRHKNF